MPYLRRRLSCAIRSAAVLILIACAAPVVQDPPAAAGARSVPAERDAKTAPGDDFYQHANGAWLAQAKIPDDYGRWGTFEQLGLTVLQQLRALVERRPSEPRVPGSLAQQVTDLYASALDQAARKAAGSTPLQPYLTLIAEINDAEGLARVLAQLQALPTTPLFQLSADADPTDSHQTIVQLSQGGLGLPAPSDYLLAERAPLRVSYLAHLTAMFTLLSRPQAAAEAASVLRLETALAAASLSPAARRDVQATTNRRSLAELTSAQPAFAWAAYFAALGLPAPGPINVENPAFIARLGQLSRSVPWADWQSYLRWHLLRGTARYLDEAMGEQAFAFYGRTLAGKTAPSAPWIRALEACNALVGEAVGQLYVAEHFPPAARARAQGLVEQLRAALDERLQALTWMSAATKQQARDKLAKLHVKLGYPDIWMDYRGLRIERGAFFSNVTRASALLWQRELGRIGRPVEAHRWSMAPQTVNAYYDPQRNEMVFPAAILQPPFFAADADDASNFGGIGSVIGHEMTHGYDDQGRQYDAEGNLRDWWTAADAAAFGRRAEQIERQFNAYRVFDQPVQGALTRGENLADLGGLTLSYRALMRLRAGLPEPAGADGLTPSQRFFFAYARIWRNSIRRETALQRLATDPHAPGIWRVNGPLVHLEPFYRAFSVKPGDRMYLSPAARIDLW